MEKKMEYQVTFLQSECSFCRQSNSFKTAEVCNNYCSPSWWKLYISNSLIAGN